MAKKCVRLPSMQSVMFQWDLTIQIKGANDLTMRRNDSVQGAVDILESN